MTILGSALQDNLVVNNSECNTADVVIASGQNLKRGSLLGKVRYGVPVTGALAGTGNGTMTLVKGGPKTKIGTYTVAYIGAISTVAAVFSVTNPDGVVLGSVEVGLGNNEIAYFFSDEISFKLLNGTTDFSTDSVFTVAVTGVIPGTASVSGTGNGTMPQVEARRLMKRGAYVATCVTAATNGGVFNIVDPDGNTIGSINVSKRTGTGTGALTEIKAGPLFKANGAYKIKCTVAATNGGTFSVTDPDGNVVGTFSLPGSSTGSATFNSEHISFKLADATDFVQNDEITLYWFESDQIACVIWDGSTDFIVGDSFTCTAALANEECKLVNRDNTDGSQFAYAILADDVDATSAAAKAIAYLSGTFNERRVYIGGNETVENYRDELRVLGIYLATSSKAV
jgi:hypothetical protein